MVDTYYNQFKATYSVVNMEFVQNNRCPDPEVKEAYRLYRRAIKDGVLQPKSCEVCGSGSNIHGHHADYSKPLDVMWLCAKHHRKWHWNNKRAPTKAELGFYKKDIEDAVIYEYGKEYNLGQLILLKNGKKEEYKSCRITGFDERLSGWQTISLSDDYSYRIKSGASTNIYSKWRFAKEIPTQVAV